MYVRVFAQGAGHSTGPQIIETIFAGSAAEVMVNVRETGCN